MRRFLAIIICLSIYAFAPAQDVHKVLKEAASLEDIPDEKAALNKFREALVISPTNIHALAKCSELCSRIGTRETSTQSRDNWYKAAFTYADIAMRVAPLNDEANVSMAMILGKTSLTKSGKEKIKDAKEIKRLVETAIKTNPNNYLAWHILGRMNYELCNINSFERAAAKLFYGGIPQGSMKNAIMYFEKTRSLMPYFILNYVELAKAYNKEGQNSKAISLLKTIQGFPVNTEDDLMHKADALKMIRDWQ